MHDDIFVINRRNRHTMARACTQLICSTEKRRSTQRTLSSTAAEVHTVTPFQRFCLGCKVLQYAERTLARSYPAQPFHGGHLLTAGVLARTCGAQRHAHHLVRIHPGANGHNSTRAEHNRCTGQLAHVCWPGFFDPGVNADCLQSATDVDQQCLPTCEGPVSVQRDAKPKNAAPGACVDCRLDARRCS